MPRPDTESFILRESDLPRLDARCVRWSRIARSLGWRELPARPARMPGSPPATPFSLRIGEARITACAHEDRWPVLHAIAGIADEARRCAALRILLADALAYFDSIGCPADVVVSGCVAGPRGDGDGDGDGVPVLALDCGIGLRPGLDADADADAAAALLERAARRTRPATVAPGAGRWASWRIPTVLRLGGIGLSPHRLATLRVGDGLVGCVGTRQRLWLRPFPRHGADVRIDQECMQMLEEISAHDDPDDDRGLPDGTPPPSDTAAPTGPGLIGQLAHEPLDVHCAIDGPMLTLDQAARLADGDVLELPVALKDARVSIRCLGRVIAGGRLVGLGDRLAVLVTDVATGVGHVRRQ